MMLFAGFRLEWLGGGEEDRAEQVGRPPSAGLLAIESRWWPMTAPGALSGCATRQISVDDMALKMGRDRVSPGRRGRASCCGKPVRRRRLF
jgi:hypothetical protein